MSNPPQSKHHPPPSSTSAKMKQQRISPTKNTTPIIRQQQPKKKKEDQTPAEQFFHWLTTPPEIAVVSHQEKQRKKTKQLAEYRKRQQQKQKQQQQDLTKKKTIQQPTVAMKTATEQFITKVNSTQTTTNLQQRPQPMTKEFGPLTPSQQSPKPTASGISVPGWDLDLDPPIDLPSHVPTPATIDDIILVPTSDHTLLGDKVEGAIDKTLDFIFDTKFSQKHSDSQHYNKTKKDERLHNPGVIKYAPSLETPPQSPVARKYLTATSKLLLTPPPSLSSSSPNTISATKWGPEIWEAKKSSSPTQSVTLESSTSFGDLSVSSGITFDLSDVAKQEHLLREAMTRKQKKEAALRKIHPTSSTNSDGSRRSVVLTTPTETSANQIIRKDSTQHATESTHTRTTTLSSVPTSSSTTQSASSTGPTTRSTGTTASNNITPAARATTLKTNSMQLLWMYQNSLNLQTSCNPRRGSIRYMDGEDTEGGGSSGGGKENGIRKSLTIMAAGPLVFKHYDPNPAHDDDKEDDDKDTVIDEVHNGDDHDLGRNGICSIPSQTTQHAVAA